MSSLRHRAQNYTARKCWRQNMNSGIWVPRPLLLIHHAVTDSWKILKILYVFYHSDCKYRTMKWGGQWKNGREILQSIMKEGDKEEKHLRWNSGSSLTGCVWSQSAYLISLCPSLLKYDKALRGVLLQRISIVVRIERVNVLCPTLSMAPDIAHTETRHSLDPFCRCCCLWPHNSSECKNKVFKVKQYVQRYGSPNTRLCAVTMEMALHFIFRRYSFLEAFPWGLYPWLVLMAALPLFIQLNSTLLLSITLLPFLPAQALNVSNLDFFSASSSLVPWPPIINHHCKIHLSVLHYDQGYIYDKQNPTRSDTSLNYSSNSSQFPE